MVNEQDAYAWLSFSCVRKVLSFVSFYRFLGTFQLLLLILRNSGCFLSFPQKFLGGKLTHGAKNWSPRACPAFDRCVDRLTLHESYIMAKLNWTYITRFTNNSSLDSDDDLRQGCLNISDFFHLDDPTTLSNYSFFSVVVFCGAAVHEAGRKPPISVIQSLNSLVAVLKEWSAKGEVRLQSLLV